MPMNSDDEDLEALRNAALSTLNTKPEESARWHAVGGRLGTQKDFKVKRFKRDRHNVVIDRSNLISIIPISDEPEPVPVVEQPKQECKDTSKFSRFDDSKSEESEDDEDDDVEIGDNGDESGSDVILMEDEDCLGKLLDDFEQELDEDKAAPPVKCDKSEDKIEAKKRINPICSRASTKQTDKILSLPSSDHKKSEMKREKDTDIDDSLLEARKKRFESKAPISFSRDLDRRTKSSSPRSNPDDSNILENRKPRYEAKAPIIFSRDVEKRPKSSSPSVERNNLESRKQRLESKPPIAVNQEIKRRRSPKHKPIDSVLEARKRRFESKKTISKPRARDKRSISPSHSPTQEDSTHKPMDSVFEARKRRFESKKPISKPRESDKRSISPSDSPTQEDSTNKPIDSVLEARKRRFESKKPISKPRESDKRSISPSDSPTQEDSTNKPIDSRKRRFESKDKPEETDSPYIAEATEIKLRRYKPNMIITVTQDKSESPNLEEFVVIDSPAAKSNESTDSSPPSDSMELEKKQSPMKKSRLNRSSPDSPDLRLLIDQKKVVESDNQLKSRKVLLTSRLVQSAIIGAVGTSSASSLKSDTDVSKKDVKPLGRKLERTGMTNDDDDDNEDKKRHKKKKKKKEKEEKIKKKSKRKAIVYFEKD